MRDYDQGVRGWSRAQRPGMYSATPTTGPACNTWSTRSSTNAMTRRWRLLRQGRRHPAGRRLGSPCATAGRGVPVDIHKEEGHPAAQRVFTRSMPAGKFDQIPTRVGRPARRRGRRRQRVSEHLDLRIWRTARSIPVAPLRRSEGDLQVVATRRPDRTHGSDLPGLDQDLHQDEYDFATLSTGCASSLLNRACASC